MDTDFLAYVLKAISEEFGDEGWYGLDEREQVHFVLEQAQNRLRALLEEDNTDG